MDVTPFSWFSMLWLADEKALTGVEWSNGQHPLNYTTPAKSELVVEHELVPPCSETMLYMSGPNASQHKLSSSILN